MTSLWVLLSRLCCSRAGVTLVNEGMPLSLFMMGRLWSMLLVDGCEVLFLRE